MATGGCRLCASLRVALEVRAGEQISGLRAGPPSSAHPVIPYGPVAGRSSGGKMRSESDAPVDPGLRAHPRACTPEAGGVPPGGLVDRDRERLRLAPRRRLVVCRAAPSVERRAGAGGGIGADRLRVGWWCCAEGVHASWSKLRRGGAPRASMMPPPRVRTRPATLCRQSLTGLVPILDEHLT